jgi:type I restriction enzyme R subunit
LEDYLRLVNIKNMVKEIEEAGTFSPLELKEFAKKTAELVKKHTKMEGLEATFDMVEINEHTLEELERASLSDIQKVFSLIKAIKREVINNSKSNPYLIPIGERAKKVVEKFEQKQINTLEALKTLKEIAQEINLAKIERVKVDLSDDAFAIYWYLKREGIEEEKAKDIAREMDEVFEKFPHWKGSEEQEREVRTSFYKLMLKLIQDVKKLSQIVDLLLSSIKRSAI